MKNGICTYQKTDRSMLYIMVFLILMQTCDLKNTDTTEIESRLSNIEIALGVEPNDAAKSSPED